MKNLMFILCLLMLSGNAYAQEDARFYDTEGSYKKGVEAKDPGNGGGIIDGDDEPPAPIDDYLPVLVVAALGMAVWYARKKQVRTE